MKIVVKREAIKILYYLLLVDGTVSENELDAFSKIGCELDPENFHTYYDEVVSECNDIAKSVDLLDDYTDVLQEAVDKSLAVRTNIIEEGIPPRLLLWDMIVLAYSNQDYDSSENKIVRHVVRMLDIDRNIYLEMKQMAETSVTLENELKWLENQNRPYSEIRPIVNEIEERTKVLRQSAENLIADEIIVPDPEEKNNIITKTVDSINEKVAPKLGEIKEKTGSALESAKDTVGNGVRKGTKGFLNGMTKAAKFVTKKTFHAVDAVGEKVKKNRSNADAGDHPDESDS